jgi:hypothetical protein
VPISKVTMMELLIDASVAASDNEAPARNDPAEPRDSYFGDPSSELANDFVSLEEMLGDAPDLVIALAAQLEGEGDDQLAVFVRQIEAFLVEHGRDLKRTRDKYSRQSDFVYPIH